MCLVICNDLGEGHCENVKIYEKEQRSICTFQYYASKRVYDASENFNHTNQVAKGKKRVYDDSEKLNHAKQVAIVMVSNVCLNFKPSSKA